MSRMMLPIGDIGVTDRLRDVDEDYAQAIAQSILDAGKYQPEEPIKVRLTPNGKKPWTLVDGGHRMRAIEIIGGTEIAYTEWKGDKAQARLAEIDSNLMRAELTALDRALFLAERKRIYETLHPETKHGGDRRSDQDRKSAVLKFTADAAQRIGLSEDAVERAVLIANRLDKAAVKALRGSKDADNTSRLLKLARLEPEERAMALNLYDQDVPLADAITQATGGKAKPKPFAEQKFEQLVRAWTEAPAQSRRRFFEVKGGEVQRLLDDFVGKTGESE